MKISIIVVTQNRPRHLRTCIKAILRSKFQHYELIIVDQSNTESPFAAPVFHGDNIKYFPILGKGKSVGLNFAISKAKGNAIVFTDDDCIVDALWLDHISRYFLSHPDTACVFGNTLPYQPKKHRGLVCPAVTGFIRPVIYDPSLIFEQELGKGNNMAWRRVTLSSLGGFKTWLGPGAFSGTAGGEESEMVYRALLAGKKIGYSGDCVVYHNKWISTKDNDDLLEKKNVGNIAFLVYYLFVRKDMRIFKKIFGFPVRFFILVMGFSIGIHAYWSKHD